MGKVKNFANDFKKFISQGNILDMAVGVVVGTAFKAIVSSLVADIIMPCIGYLLGDVNFTDLKWVLVKGVDEVVEEGVVVTEAVAEVAVKYGQFIQYIIDFLIIAFAMFIVVKVAMSFR
ncbi:MAG: large conductance mechanosensitive channel protein MscL, partial [Clostridia bacterium]|nr:large conductance mechanosensitive channel protein MscL [Clostridia bacterium]